MELEDEDGNPMFYLDLERVGKYLIRLKNGEPINHSHKLKHTCLHDQHGGPVLGVHGCTSTGHHHMAAANLTSSKGRGWSLACHDPQLLPIGLDLHDPLRCRLAVELKQS